MPLIKREVRKLIMQNLKRFGSGSFRLLNESEEQITRYNTSYEGALSRLTGEVQHVVFGYITTEDEYVLAGENGLKYRMFNDTSKYNEHLIQMKKNGDFRSALVAHV